MESYAKRTYNSSNPFVRYAHRQRMNISLDFLPIKENIRILDYGCGDGNFLISLYNKYKSENLNLSGFEPFQNTMENNNIRFFKDISKIKEKEERFDTVCCFEVLEHFNVKNQRIMLTDISELLKPDGIFVVSVPIETGFPSLLKNIFRKINYPNSENYSFKNIWKSFIGVSLEEFRLSDEYLSHTGFNHKNLESLFSEKYTISKKRYSPFRFFGKLINSQVFYLLLKK